MMAGCCRVDYQSVRQFQKAACSMSYPSSREKDSDDFDDSRKSNVYAHNKQVKMQGEKGSVNSTTFGECFCISIMLYATIFGRAVLVLCQMRCFESEAQVSFESVFLSSLHQL